MEEIKKRYHLTELKPHDQGYYYYLMKGNKYKSTKTTSMPSVMPFARKKGNDNMLNFDEESILFMENHFLGNLNYRNKSIKATKDEVYFELDAIAAYPTFLTHYAEAKIKLKVGIRKTHKKWAEISEYVNFYKLAFAVNANDEHPFYQKWINDDAFSKKKLLRRHDGIMTGQIVIPAAIGMDLVTMFINEIKELKGEVQHLNVVVTSAKWDFIEIDTESIKEDSDYLKNDSNIQPKQREIIKARLAASTGYLVYVDKYFYYFMLNYIRYQTMKLAEMLALEMDAPAAAMVTDAVIVVGKEIDEPSYQFILEEYNKLQPFEYRIKTVSKTIAKETPRRLKL